MAQDVKGVLRLDVPKCCTGQLSDPEQHPNRYWCLCLDLCLASLEFAGANTPNKLVRLPAPATYQGSYKTSPKLHEAHSAHHRIFI